MAANNSFHLFACMTLPSPEEVSLYSTLESTLILCLAMTKKKATKGYCASCVSRPSEACQFLLLPFLEGSYRLPCKEAWVSSKWWEIWYWRKTKARWPFQASQLRYQVCDWSHSDIPSPTKLPAECCCMSDSVTSTYTTWSRDKLS